MKDIAAVLAAALFLGGVFATLAAHQAGFKRQPIAYNHKKHIDAGLDCPLCHTGIAEGRERARLPARDVCMGCHESDDNPKTQAIRDFAAREEAIPWRQVYELPDHVYFSHRRHVSSGGLDCAECHGDMKTREKPVTRQAVSISMTRCVACHRARGVTTDCLACHR